MSNKKIKSEPKADAETRDLFDVPELYQTNSANLSVQSHNANLSVEHTYHRSFQKPAFEETLESIEGDLKTILATQEPIVRSLLLIIKALIGDTEAVEKLKNTAQHLADYTEKRVKEPQELAGAAVAP